MKRLLFFIATFMVSLGLYAQSLTISGIVTQAEDNAPLPGVSVVAEGTTIGAITDFEGHYEITVPQTTANLKYTFVGMRTEVIAIGAQTTINVAMAASTEEIDEVVVVGYGSKRKGSIAGAVSTVKAEKIEQKPVGSFDAMLQGQVAGMQVITSSGAPGASATVRIRGINSINAGTQPLYIMDGVQITSGDFSALNANDIDDIAVLKDAAATSIYGSRGANGVVIITSKRGKNRERTEVMYRTQFGRSFITQDNIGTMNSQEKIDYEISLGMRDPNNPENDSLRNVNTNWKDEFFQNANMNSHELSARGGNAKTAFYISGGYYYQDGIQYRSDLKRYTARINLDHKASKRLTIGTYLTAGYEEIQNPVLAGNNIYNLAFRAYLENPYRSPYRADGSYATPEDGLAWANPIQQLDLNDEMDDRIKVVGSVFADYKILPYLSFRTTFGVDFNDYTNSGYLHPESAWGATNGGEVYRQFSRSYRLTNTNLLTFNKDFGKSNVTAYLGQESINYDYEWFETEGFTLPNNVIKQLDGTATAGDNWGGDISEYAVLSGFIHAEYTYDNKYMVEANFRMDGSSRFGPENRWAPFWSVGGWWNMKRESFLADSDVISQMRLRASIGTVGNYNIGNYLHLQTYSFAGSYYDMNASFPSSPGNPALTWEITRQGSVGIDMQLIERLGFTVDLYHKLTSNMLFEIPFSYTSGFSGGWGNIGDMVNKGIEFSTDMDIVRTSDFVFNLDLNLAYNHNEITYLEGDKEEMPSGQDSDWYHSLGRPYGSWKNVEYVGVNSANGERIFLDADGNPTNTYSLSNRMYQEKSWIAPWQGGFTFTASWKGLRASAFFTWVQGKYMINNTRYFMESNGQFAAYGQSTRMLDAWEEPGDITDIPKADFSNYFDSRLLEDASFMRLKNLMVSYSLPQKAIEATRIFQSLRVYAQAQNLVTWTKYLGYDPEYDAAYELGSYPHVKTFTIGLDVGF